MRFTCRRWRRRRPLLTLRVLAGTPSLSNGVVRAVLTGVLGVKVSARCEDEKRSEENPSFYLKTCQECEQTGVQKGY
ncbi:hypothetical protein MUG91_G51n110 [Manis pentadactyla]|nr:hypothetical protein MUG91_G51n110 [Manis pentadactyla]